MATGVTTSTTTANGNDTQEGFVTGPWTEDIDVRDFIQRNYDPCDSDASLLADATDKTLRLWDTLEKDYLSRGHKVRILDVDAYIPTDTDASPAGYINEDDDATVGLQTDSPLRRAMTPNDGWRMAGTAIKKAGKEVDPEVEEIFTHYHEAHNDAVFDIYTPHIHAAHSSHIITGLPDAYGRGRIIGDYHRVALYGVDFLIEQRQKAKDAVAGEPFSEHQARYHEGHSKQIKTLKKLKVMAASYGYDVFGPAKNAHEVVQWTCFAYLTSMGSQDGVTMNISCPSAFPDIYFERNLRNGVIGETHAQELVDNVVMKLRITHFLRTINYDQIFSGDPYWATWSDAGFGEGGRALVTKTSPRLLQTLRNLGPAPGPSITTFWDESLPQGYKDFCTLISITTSSIQYEIDKQIREHQGDDATITCCVSPMCVGKQMQFFSARVNSAKALLYAINGGRDEMTGKQVVTDLPDIEDDDPLGLGEVWDRYGRMLNQVAATYVEALNIIHYCHDRYAYESIEMTLHDSDVIRTMDYGIASLSIVADPLATIKCAEVTPVRDEAGLVVDYVTEGDFLIYGNNDDRADDITATMVHMIISKIKAQPFCRDAIPAQSVLMTTPNVVYDKTTGPFLSGHQRSTPFSPGTNPEDGMDTHGMTASMLSVGKLDYNDALDGISLTNTIIPRGLGRTFDKRVASLVGILDTGFVPDGCVEIRSGRSIRLITSQ